MSRLIQNEKLINTPEYTDIWEFCDFMVESLRDFPNTETSTAYVEQLKTALETSRRVNRFLEDCKRQIELSVDTIEIYLRIEARNNVPIVMLTAIHKDATAK